MTQEEILPALTAIFRTELDDETIVLFPETVADDIAGWTSLTHILLVAAVEKKFRIRFPSREIMRWKNVGDLMSALIEKAS